ncbi:hypothetical protein [Paenibacillus camelliae]|uniref:hypothetical protein n=1 Tax=Paenibacillus camelliae TaxID=512410 RepID=UPI00203D6440|nr:hypothetical protein [Paenibacillus camelliae]MCM3632796.1 hypothetical protein [Paenibacillus camelliae]
MIEHKPTNAGSSGSVGYSVGAGYGWGQGLNASVAFSWSQNWSNLDFTDNSTLFFDGSFFVSGGLQSKVVTVDASSVSYLSDNFAHSTVSTSVNVEFDSWNTFPVTKGASGTTEKIYF